MITRAGGRVHSLRTGAILTAVAVVVQSMWLASRYPASYLDADLLSYLSYYRDWMAGMPVPFGYTVPKLLPVLLLGPLGSPRLALTVSILASAAGGALLFAIAWRSFGAVVAAVAAVLYAFDPMRGVLTLRSSVDLLVGVALLGAIHALQHRAVVWAGVMILLAALAKPPAIACALALPFLSGAKPSRRALATFLPLLAVPATAWLDAALERRSVAAGVLSMTLPDQHELFVRVAQARVLGFAETIDLIMRQWFGGTLFARTWPLAVLGLALYLLRPLAGRLATHGRAESAHRLERWTELPHAAGRASAGPVQDSGDPPGAILIVPLLLALAYTGLALVHPMIVFTRFFWPLALVLALFAAAGAVWLATRISAAAPIRAAFAAVVVAALLADRLEDHRWRARLMLEPFETHAALADEAVARIARDDGCSGPVVVPLAYLPLAAWRAPDKLRRGELCAIEDWADGRGCATPTCVLFIPQAPTTPRAREAVGRLVRGGFVVEVGDESGALVRSSSG